MRRRLGTIGTTDIWIHPAAALTAVYMIFTGSDGWLAAALLSIVLHEGAHALVSSAFGKPPKDIELTPLGMLMRLEDDEALPPLGRFLTVLAGPAMTFLLCVCALMGTKYGLLNYALGRAFFMSNLSILLLNMLPALPLDGGRMLAQLLGLLFQPSIVQRIMRALGMLAGLFCIGLNLWLTWQIGGWNLSLTAAGCFLMYSAVVSTTSHAMSLLRTFTDRKIRLENHGILRAVRLAACSRVTMQQAVRRLHPRRYTFFTVVEEGSQKCIGELGEQEVIAGFLAHPAMSMRDHLRQKNDQRSFRNEA